MNKKQFIPSFFIGALVIFSILPWINYVIDPWRVLHHDYTQGRKGIDINKAFLKTSYLQTHPNKYDTLLLGSSRNAAFNETLFSEHTYNMEYTFGILGMHIQNLKVLLENGVSIKKIWLGINDYVIWKEPTDHASDFSRKTYTNNLINKWDFYSFYLLRKLDFRDFEILEGKYPLVESNRILRKDISKYYAYLEKDTRKRFLSPDIWRKKMTSQGSILLGYKDEGFRVDKAITEMEELISLCNTYHIELVLFMYPSFYKTYLQYNQFKINDFKKKLAKLINFHDFYSLNHFSLNELNWSDSSHFTVLTANQMIQDIKQNKFLVTKENIHSHIMQTNKSIQDLLTKIIPIPYIYKFNWNIDLSALKPLFDLKNTTHKFYSNSQLLLNRNQNHTVMTSLDNDPIIILNQTNTNSDNIILSCQIESDKKTIFQIFYKKTDKSKYNEQDTLSVSLQKGLNQFNLLIPSHYLHNGLRIDPVSNKGIYTIKNFTVYGL